MGPKLQNRMSLSGPQPILCVQREISPSLLPATFSPTQGAEFPYLLVCVPLPSFEQPTTVSLMCSSTNGYSVSFICWVRVLECKQQRFFEAHV
jgi:hypothetical protein